MSPGNGSRPEEPLCRKGGIKTQASPLLLACTDPWL